MEGLVLLYAISYVADVAHMNFVEYRPAPTMRVIDIASPDLGFEPQRIRGGFGMV